MPSSESHSSTRRLERSRVAYEAVLDNVDSSIFVTIGDDARIVFANQCFRKRFTKDCLGRPAGEFLDLPEGDSGGDVHHFEVYDQSSKMWLSVSVEDIAWVDGSPARLFDCHDVTERKLYADKLREASQAKTNFLARTSHEIRTPMNAIIGMSELILREDITSAVREHANNIKQAGATLLSIINDILDYSKIESGKLEIISANYRLASLIADVVSIIRIRLMGKALHFIVNIDPDLPSELCGDEVRLRQIFLNLLGNAVKFTREGFIRLDVTGVERKDDILLSAAVTDTGSGIRPDDLKRLFKDFIQVDVKANRGIEGTGLGLTITKNLCEAMGGRISVESEYGLGSTFQISIPQTIVSRTPLASVSNAGALRVIVAADRREYADSIAASCTWLGVAVQVYERPESVLSALGRGGVTHLFISPLVSETLGDRLDERIGSAELVLLTDIGSDGNRLVRTLSMPAHAVAIADVLNNVVPEFGSADMAGNDFIAPEARVLVVDDNATNLKVAEGLLQPYQLRVDTCLGGREAVQLAVGTRYDIIFMDHMMPEMDGLEAAARILEVEYPSGRRPIIIMLTANAMSGVREMFLERGLDDFIAKPIEVARLDAALARWLPEDKKFPVTATSAEEAPPDSHEPVLVDGLNWNAGLTNMGGSEELYRQVLTSFCTDSRVISGQIRECLRERDLNRFTIYVHSLKSTLASIGADGLSILAQRLEAAGLRADWHFVVERSEEFLNAVAQLAEVIRVTWLDGAEPERRSGGGEAGTLKVELAKLRLALDGNDTGGAELALRSLRKYKWGEYIDQQLKMLADDLERNNLEGADARAGMLFSIV